MLFQVSTNTLSQLDSYDSTLLIFLLFLVRLSLLSTQLSPHNVIRNRWPTHGPALTFQPLFCSIVKYGK